MSGSAISLLRWSAIETFGGWQAAVLPVPEFPLPLAYAAALERFSEALGEVLRGPYRLKQQLFLQVWKLGPETGAPDVSANRRAWRPQLGLGVWPNRLPPGGWTEERMVDAAAAIYRGDEPELPSHRLLRLCASPADTVDAARTMRRFGVLLEMFCPGESTETDARAREMFLPRIKASRFLQEEFYAPLLDRGSLLSAGPTEEIGAMLCGADVYLRDSAEDKGVLIVSRFPLLSLFEQVRRTLEQSVAKTV